MRQEKILYFVRGTTPTPEQRESAASMNAFIRNADAGCNDFVETCDAVAGDVPDAYAHFPREAPAQPAQPVQDGPTRKPLNHMGLEELKAEVVALGLKPPSNVNTKQEYRDFITAHFADADSHA